MDALSIIALASGVTIGVLSSIATFFNKQRFEAQITLLQAGNDELRKQNEDLRIERTDMEKSNLAAQVRYDEQRKLVEEYKRQNLRLPDFTQLSKQTNQNHTEVVKKLTEIAKILVEK